MLKHTLSPLRSGNSRRPLLAYFLLFVFVLSYATSALAYPVLEARQQRDPGTIGSSSDGPLVNINGRTLTVHAIILAVLLILFGLFLVFSGYRHIRLTAFIAGAIVFGLITWIGLTNAEPSAGYGPHATTIYLVVSVGVGLVLGAVAACCWRVGVWLVGALGFWALGLWILSWKAGGVITPYWGRILFLALMAVAGLVLTIFFERFVIIITTSIGGAFAVFFGLDIFLNTGFMYATLQFLDSRHTTAYDANPKALGMLGGVAALALLGIIVQYFQRSRYGPAVYKEPVDAVPPRRRFFFF
ncbi:uncharacterized protein VTP21DRAFT_396 [Calcarisporiella thermophila]|uniref:uncharacterized protein n=1 Tax=Calcarisporiella thermophila TaxID=911321 RepID=UPI003743407B